MLVEVWHHVLKGTYMEGKCNRRVDQLIHILINVALPNYIANHCAQQFGFHGPNLALRKWNEINQRAVKITSEMIEEIEPGRLFTVKLQTTPGVVYTVDLKAYKCVDCPSFPVISFCKHICAVENHFPDYVVSRSLPIASQPWDDHDNQTDYTPILASPTSILPHAIPAVSGSQNTLLLLQLIVNKLQFLQRNQQLALPQPLTDSLRHLDNDLAGATRGAEILPKIGKKLPPNGRRRLR
ncbi:hypothetical protein DFH09DRAFT_1338333 [Mycena vulgaris]|nr:hypothetical protein DFH09DRAFT_1338333 [Mycena vulgaris]